MKIDGSCHCGAIAFEAELDPGNVGICHCTDCQKLSASAYRMIAMVDGASFKLLKGHPKEYVKIGDSGNRRVQAFCGTCGSGLYAANADGERAKINIRAGTITQRNQLVPRFEVWRASAQPWLPDLPGTDKFDKNAVYPGPDPCRDDNRQADSGASKITDIGGSNDPTDLEDATIHAHLRS